MVIASIAMNNKVGRDVAWNYFKKNHHVFVKIYGSGPILARLVKVINNYLLLLSTSKVLKVLIRKLRNNNAYTYN